MRNILNIINFVRGAEPRNRSLDLVEPVREQIRLMKRYQLPGTFLVTYDALIREDICELLKALDPKQFEVGLWLEMNEPHTEAAGLPWRGRTGFEWDWHANVGFSVGYNQSEREQLVDVFVEKFQECFGRLPKSVGSWMIDAYTLLYLSESYNIVSSCNCKDQWGTDGYTIWGGYWNQGYYPSRNNALSPAQTIEQQISVPVFRMLGSDPVTQYDLGLRVDEGAAPIQQVATLEPVYNNVGGNPLWVDWFMRQSFTGNSLAFAYAQAGQENSFGWSAMQAGLEYQFPLFAEWREKKGLVIERLEDTGRWYRDNFQLTPATSVCALEPWEESGAQSIWYDCKNYRANLYIDKNGLRLRDLTLFDENYAERYLSVPCITDYLVYDNLSIIDGNRMSGNGILAGAWLVNEQGELLQRSRLYTVEDGSSLKVEFDGGYFIFDETSVRLFGGFQIQMRWDRQKSDLLNIDDHRLIYRHNEQCYSLFVKKGELKPNDMPTIGSDTGEICLQFERLGK